MACASKRVARGHLPRQKKEAYNSRWFVGDPRTVRQLRERYHHNAVLYRHAYRPDQEVLDYYLEQCMKHFARLTKSVLRPEQLKQLVVFDDLSNTLASESPLHLTIVSIDFEGTVDERGINEYGIASIDLSQNNDAVFEHSIDVSTYVMARHRGRQNLWGEVTRITHELLPGCIRDTFAELKRASPQNKIMLTGHGVTSELVILRDIGITIDNLSVTEVLDTLVLGQRILECKSLSLQRLLEELSIPTTPDSLHSAGNDAHYTIQALLGLMQVQTGRSLGRLGALVKAIPPRIRHWGERIPSHEQPEDILAACELMEVF